MTDKLNSPKTGRSIADSFNAAIEGFLFVVRTQRNMRVHFLAALFVILLGIYLNFSRIEMIALVFTSSLVLVAEMINTSIEIVMDHVESSHSRWVKAVKDVSAGAVFIASINAMVAGYFLFFKDNVFDRLFRSEISKLSSSDWHIYVFILITLIGIVIISKAVLRRGRPLRGGMPSGHSAVAFSVWMITALLCDNTLIVFMVSLLAFMVAQSRVRRNYHTVPEVVIGGLLGIFLTLFLFRLLTA
ncbi:MAG: diacylglycerol kinase [Candidatus Omnitrophica bacterium]|nr:diacylglycerol kinase [Candidatus Omnitrophota bacterium]